MDWARDLPTWPHADLSRRIECRPHRWHVQEVGEGPLILLLHGAGASAHSWRDLIPLLAKDHRVIALDLPGQGFSQPGARSRLGLPGMTQDIASLCQAQGWQPQTIIGHSAGGCLALSLGLILGDEQGRPPAIIGINAALDRFEGVAGWLFPMLAKLLALNPLTALAFSAGPNPTGRARRLIAGTGSTISAEGIGLYARLLSDRAHVDGTLQMMAQWDTKPLLARLNRIEARCLLIAGARDSAVPPDVSRRAAGMIPGAEFRLDPALGHLMHEECPVRTAALILDWLAILRQSSPVA